MKLKRFLALAVSLAMVLSIVPAFSLTASAAEIADSAIYEYAKSTTTLFDAENPAPTATNDAAVETAYPESGITATINTGYLNVNEGPRFQSYIGSNTNGNQAVNYLNLPGYGVGNDWVLVSYVTEYTNAWGEVFLFDTNSQLLTGVRFGTSDSNAMSVDWGHSGWGNSMAGQFPSYTLSNTGKTTVASGSSVVDVLLRNYDGYYTATYYVNGAEYCVGTYTDTTFNGLGQIGLCRNSGNAWTRISLQDLKIYAGNNPSSSDATTIGSALSELEVAAITKGTDVTLATTATDSFDTTVDVTWTSSNEDVIANNGTVGAVEDVTTVTLTPSTVYGGETITGAAKTVTVFPAAYSADATFTAGGASYNLGEAVDLSSVSWYTRKSTAESVYPVTGLTEETVNGVKVTTLPGLAGAGALGDSTVNARTSIAVTPGQAYVLRFYYGGADLANSTYAYNKIYTTAAAYEDEVAIDYVSGDAGSSISTAGEDWTKVEEVFVPSSTANFLTFVYSWQEAGLKIADMELYTLVEDTTVVETVASVGSVAPVKVIGDTTVVLPATVKVTGSLGSEIDAPIVWDAPSSYAVGTTEVSGVATIQFGEQEATTEAVSTTVTVLEETFTLEDAESFGAQPGNVVYFPVEIADEFNIEFDYTVNEIGDASVQMGYNGTMFGAGALGISPNGNVLKVTGGNKAGTGEGVTLVESVAAGDVFHMFLTLDASDDTYTLTVTKPDGTVVTTGEKGFRQAHDAINTMTILLNGKDINNTGTIAVSNIKVNSTVAKTEFTFVVTKDGETTSTTGSFWTAAEAEASVVDYEDYHKEVTVDGTTVTVVYTNTKVVAEEIESIATPADITVFGNEAVVLPATLSVTGSFGTVVDAAVVWDAPATYPAGTTTVNGTLTVQFNDTAEAITEAVSVNVTLIDEFTLDDFTSVNGQTAGKNNQKVFPVAIRGAFTMQFTANYASFGDLFITIKTKDAGFFGPEQIALGVNGTNAFRPVDGNGAGSRANADADQAFLTTGVDYGFIITSDASTDKYSVVIYDKATGVVVAEVNDFGYRTNADAIEAITALTNNGAGEVTLTNIKVDTSVVELVTVTVDGVAKKVVGGSYSQALTGAVLVDADGNIYAPVDGVVTVPVDADMVLTTKALGLEMVSGAQVRIGATELEEGAKLDALADSGIRFLATADYNDTLISEEGVEFGIKVTAEGSDKVVYVPAETFQNDDNTVFSAAITNLATSNYNRKYTAVAYAKVGDVEITTDSVTRSIYQVSAGLMKGDGTAENGDAYTVDGVVKNILNAYVNQVGVRIEYNGTEWVADDVYTGDVFFAVESADNGDGTVTVTITPDTTWGTPVEIATWWADYVRANNSNKAFNAAITDSSLENGVLTITFTAPAAE